MRASYQRIIAAFLLVLFAAVFTTADECARNGQQCNTTTSMCKSADGSYQCSCKDSYHPLRLRGTGCYDTSQKCSGVEFFATSLRNGSARLFTMQQSQRLCEYNNATVGLSSMLHNPAMLAVLQSCATRWLRDVVKNYGGRVEAWTRLCDSELSACQKIFYDPEGSDMYGFTGRQSTSNVKDTQIAFCQRDIDECKTGHHGCNHQTSHCINFPGSYQCLCRAGFAYGEGASCVDINECKTSSHRCEAGHSDCRNTLGSYLCDCTGDRVHVVDQFTCTIPVANTTCGRTLFYRAGESERKLNWSEASSLCMQTGGSLTNTASNETCVRRLLRSLTGRSAEKAVHIWTGTCDANSTACDVWIVKRDDPTSDSLEKSRNTQRRKRTRIAVCEKPLLSSIQCWSFQDPHCTPCPCERSLSQACDRASGSCICKYSLGGTGCRGCASGFYGFNATSATCHQVPRFLSGTKTHYTIRPGQTVNLHCGVVGGGLVTIQWFDASNQSIQEGLQFQISTSERLNFMGSLLSFTATASPGDNMYTCVSINGFKTLRKDFHVQVNRDIKEPFSATATLATVLGSVVPVVIIAVLAIVLRKRCPTRYCLGGGTYPQTDHQRAVADLFSWHDSSEIVHENTAGICEDVINARATLKACTSSTTHLSINLSYSTPENLNVISDHDELASWSRASSFNGTFDETQEKDRANGTGPKNGCTRAGPCTDRYSTEMQLALSPSSSDSQKGPISMAGHEGSKTVISPNVAAPSPDQFPVYAEPQSKRQGQLASANVSSMPNLYSEVHAKRGQTMDGVQSGTALTVPSKEAAVTDIYSEVDHTKSPPG